MEDLIYLTYKDLTESDKKEIEKLRKEYTIPHFSMKYTQAFIPPNKIVNL